MIFTPPDPPPAGAPPPTILEPPGEGPPAGSLGRRLRLLGLLLVALTIVGLGTAFGLARYGGAYAIADFAADSSVAGEKTITPRRAEAIETKLEGQKPRGVYLTVDTFRNRLRVWKDGKILREALCSTGTGIVLKDPRTGRQWVFDTPLGERKILNKVRNPVWSKPDWAFIEEGYEPPPKGSPDRFDDISLGAYALYMKDQYIIHGTLFKTLLGQRVTHGCVRLGDEDLEYVYKTIPVGARVFLY